MCHGVCASDVTGLACVMASVRQMSWRLCVRCHRFGMCHGVCASDVMASVRQMSCHVMLKLPLGNYVKITEQYKGMCFNLNSSAIPESSSLKVLSTPSFLF